MLSTMTIPAIPFFLYTLFVLSARPVIAAYNLVDKRVLVTGSSGGIGSGIAIALAQKGARIVVHYNTRREGAEETARFIRDHGGICDGIVQSDFRIPANIPELFRQLDDIWGEGSGPDVLVNNAGVVSKLAVEDDDEDLNIWMETMQVNLHASYHLSKLAYQRMNRIKGKEKGGVIINVSPIHGSISVEYMTAYAASKAGLDRLTAGLASEWAQDNIRVNAVAPGAIPVERTEAFTVQESPRLMVAASTRGEDGKCKRSCAFGYLSL